MKEFSLQEIKDKLKSYNTKPFYYKHYMEKYDPEMWEYVSSKTVFLESPVFMERIYCLENNITSPVLCKECKQKKVKFDVMNNVYRNFCSPRCSTLNSDTKKKMKKTLFDRYGVEHQAKSTKIKNKIKRTNLERYGTEYGLQNEEIRNKIKKTKLERYGNENYFNYEKSKQTCLERYGVEYSFQSENNKRKSKKTCLRKYKVSHIGKSKLIKEKISKTCNEKYGTNFPVENKEIYEKTQLSRKIRIYNEKILKDKKCEILTSLDEFIKNPKDKLKWKCKTCGNVFESKINHNYLRNHNSHARCIICHPNLNGTSYEEKDFFKFIKSVYSGEIKENFRKLIPPYEIDTYLPDKKLAFEFDGNFWHSTMAKHDESYHLMKTDKCNNKGIRLVHVVENQWLNKNIAFKNKINLIIHDSETFIDEIKLEIKEISLEEAKSFIKTYDVFTRFPSKNKYYGLFENAKLISVVELAISKKKIKIEKFVSTKCYNRTFQILIEHIKTFGCPTIEMKIDRMTQSGDFLENAGFKLIKTLSPKQISVSKKLKIFNCGFKLYKYSV